MFVLTADQRDSTRTGERVDALLSSLGPWRERWDDAIALPVERTVGDEFQAVLTDANAVVDLALALMREEDWSVGIGAGEVNMPLADSARASSGPAFVLARDAVERARGRREPVPVVVRGADKEASQSATAVLQLIGAVLARRTDAGWQVADAWTGDATQRDVARALGISPQAVSQRIAAALIEEERAARPVAASLVARAAGGTVGP